MGWEVMKAENWDVKPGIIRRKIGVGMDAAFEDPLPSEGVHEVSFTIVKSPLGCVCLYLGICDAEHVHKYKQRSSNPNVEEEIVAWAFCGACGYLCHFRSPHEEYSSGWRQHAMPKTQNLADTKRAKGAVVKAIVDMDKRTLAFKVNDEELVDAKVELPASVRPFILISQTDDTIRMSVTRLETAPPA